jgi:hypothetical protein
MKPCCLTLILLLASLCGSLRGQTAAPADSTRTSATDSTRTAAKGDDASNLRFSILGGPGYTPDFGVLVGGSALLTFSTDPSDPALQRSVLPISFGLTFAKPLGVNLMVKPQVFFEGDRVRLFGTYVYKNTNDNYYGVGYGTARHVERGEGSTQYTASSIQVNPVVQLRVGESDFFVGPLYDFITERVSKPGKYVVADPLYTKQGGDSTGLRTRNSGLGFVGSYDTRDVAANAYRGVFLELKVTGYLRALGGQYNFGNVSLDYRQYVPLTRLGKRRVLAWTVNCKNVFGDVPFTRYPLIGSPFDLRGYYMGQYRDRSTLVALAEYRHMFNCGYSTRLRRLLSKLGFAVWGGAGMLGPRPMKYEAVLPNFGAGLRIEVQPRMNFRFDVGRSPIDKQTLIYFNMTEAF